MKGKLALLHTAWSEYTTVQPFGGNSAINSNIKNHLDLSSISLGVYPQDILAKI